MKRILIVTMFVVFATSMVSAQIPTPTPKPTLENVKIDVPAPEPAAPIVISVTEYERIKKENQQLKQQNAILLQNIDALLIRVVEAESKQMLILKQILVAPDVNVIRNMVRQILVASLNGKK